MGIGARHRAHATVAVVWSLHSAHAVLGIPEVSVFATCAVVATTRRGSLGLFPIMFVGVGTDVLMISDDGKFHGVGRSSMAPPVPVLDLGERGAQLVAELVRLVEETRSADMAANTLLRDGMHAHGARVWQRMRATFGDLPDVGFRYSDVERRFDDDRVYAVFDGATAVLRRDDRADPPAVSVRWETQTGEPGWIGLDRRWCGRGEAVDECDVPLVAALRKALAPRTSLDVFMGKLYVATEDRRSYLNLFHRERGYDRFGALPVLDIRVDCDRAVLTFDGRDVCAAGQLPPADADLPAFFDRVRDNRSYWNGLYHHVVKHSDCGC